MTARSRRPMSECVGIESRSCRAWEGVSTGVFPFRTTCLGPLTPWQGFVGHTCPMTRSSKSMRIAARSCFAVAGDRSRVSPSMYVPTTTGRSDASEKPLASHQDVNCSTAVRYACRVFGFRIRAVKNSMKRIEACSPAAATSRGGDRSAVEGNRTEKLPLVVIGAADKAYVCDHDSTAVGQRAIRCEQAGSQERGGRQVQAVLQRVTHH